MCTRRRWSENLLVELDDWGGTLKPVTRQRRNYISGGEELTSTLGVLCVCMKIVRVPREVLGDGRDDG